ncbi:MAG: hypothetical protein H0T60_13860 [Acidobacteria bacterium]|nr:hypothetical protein [Acidobacteriota bacterium]
MFMRSKALKVAALALLLLALNLSTSAAALAQDKKKKEKKSLPPGKAVLWEEPRDIDSRDLLLGPGGARMRPEVSRLEFVKEEKDGWSKKYRVRDAAGKVWVAKLSKEAQSETAAVRLVWAVGYPTEINYLVPCVRIEGAPQPKEAEACAGGGYRNVRLEARPEGIKRLDEWSWVGSPFEGRREMQGLKVLMVFLNNWDTKDDNNVVFHVQQRGTDELQYIISDLGATLGKTGGGRLWKLKRSRNAPEDYAEAKFIDRVEKGYVRFSYAGVNTGMLDKITVADARWLGGWLARLSERQIGDAFRAANYTPEEVRIFTGAVRARVRELTTLPK